MDRRTAKNHRIILDTALRLFLQEGAGAITVERLARAADISRATVYNHFHGLEGVLDELVLPALEKSISVFEILNHRNFVAFDEILSSLLTLWKENRESFLVACVCFIPLQGELKRRHEEFLTLFRSILGRVAEAQMFRIPDVSKTAYLVFKTFPEVLRVSDGMENSEELFRSCMRALVLRGSNASLVNA